MQNDTPPKPPRRWPRRLLITCGIILLVLLVLGITLHTPWARAKVLDILSSKLAKQGIHLSADSLDYNLLSLSFTLVNPVLGKKGPGQQPPLFKSGRLEVNLPLSLLLGKGLHLQKLETIKPELLYRVNKDGTTNLPGTGGKKKPAQTTTAKESPPDFLDIQRLHIPGAKITYTDIPRDLHLVIPSMDIQVTSKIRSEGLHKVHISTAGGSRVQYAGHVLAVSQLNIDGLLDSRRLELNTCRIGLAKDNSFLEVRGEINHFLSSPTLALTVEGRGILPELAELFLPPDIEMKKGTASFRLQVNKPAHGPLEPTLETFNANLQLEAAGTELSASVRAKGPRLSGAISVDVEEFTRLYPLVEKHLPSLYPTLAQQLQPKGDISLKGKLGGTLTAPNLTVEVTSQRLSLMKELEFSPTGTVTYKKGNKNMVTARLTLGQAVRRGRLIGDVPVHADFSNDGKLTLELHVPALGLETKAQLLTTAPYPLSGELMLKNLSLKDILRFLETDVVPGTGGEISGRTEFKLDLDNPLETTEATLHLDALRLIKGDRVLENQGPIRASYGPTGLDIRELALQSTGTAIKVSGRLPLESPPGEGLEVRAYMNGMLLKSFLPAAEFKGRLDLQAHIGGSLKHPDITGKATCTGATLEPGGEYPAIENIHLGLSATRESLSFTPLAFTWAGGKFRLEGEVPVSALPISLPGAQAAPKDINLTLFFEGLSQDTLNAVSPGPSPMVPQGFTFRTDGNCRISGKKLDTAGLKARLTLDQLELGAGTLTFKQENPTVVNLEEGTVSIEHLELKDGENQLQLTGNTTLEDNGSLTLDLRLEGKLPLKKLDPMMEGANLSGTGTVRFQAAGTVSAPVVTGTLLLENGGFHHPDVPLIFKWFNGTLALKDGKLAVEELKGNVNGGTMSITGGLTAAPDHPDGFDGLDLGVDFDNLKLNSPEGFQSGLSGSLKLVSHPARGQGKFLLKGDIEIMGAAYRELVSLGSDLYDYLFGQAELPAPRPVNAPADAVLSEEAEDEPGFLERLSLDIGIDTVSPLLVDNNLARMEITADLTLRGSPDYPVLSGRALLEEGGRFHLGTNTFTIERGVIDFLNPVFIEPDMAITAATRVMDYDIQLSVAGTPGKLAAVLTSTPPLAEADIITLLVQGKKPGSTSGFSLDALGNQALAYLGGSLAGRLSRVLKRASGLDIIQIDTGLSAPDETPEARLTIGENITPNLQLVLTQGLRQSSNRTWMVNYTPWKNISLQGKIKNDEEYGLSLRHRWKMGDKKIKAAQKKKNDKKRLIRTIRNITITGNTGIGENGVRKKLRLKKGKPFDFFALHKGLERLKNTYRRKGYLNVEMDSSRKEEGKYMDIQVNIQCGPLIRLALRGTQLPRKLRKLVKRKWMEGALEEHRIRNVSRLLLDFLHQKQFHGASIEVTKIERNKNELLYTLDITPGPIFAPPALRFEGNDGLRHSKLEAFLRKEHLIPLAFSSRKKVSEALQQFYRDEGFLYARVSPPVVKQLENENRMEISFDIRENLRPKIGKLSFQGNTFLEDKKLARRIAHLAKGYLNREKLGAMLYLLKAHYASLGFNDAAVISKPAIRTQDKKIDLCFVITEGRRGVIENISVKGNIVTGEHVIRRELRFGKGEFVDAKKIAASRKRLYETGLFLRANIEVIPLYGVSPEYDNNNEDQPCHIEVSVTEIAPWLLGYGVNYNTETYLGVEGNIQNRNVLGSGRHLGFSFRLNRGGSNGRLFFKLPYILKQHLRLEGAVFAERREEEDQFTEDRLGLTLQQRFKLNRYNLVALGYTLERRDTLTTGEPGTGNRLARRILGHLTLAYTLDSRDNLLDASKGVFLSQSLQLGAKWMAGDFSFQRYFGRLNVYVPISTFLTSASSIRIGLASGLDGELVPGEKFFAGGGDSIRGLGYHKALPEGGEALFIINQELRFRLTETIGTVLFLDIGNAFPQPKDISPSNLREAIGIGLRYRTSFLLLRLDWGFLLDRQQGEPKSRVFFSVGQSF